MATFLVVLGLAPRRDPILDSVGGERSDIVELALRPGHRKQAERAANPNTETAGDVRAVKAVVKGSDPERFRREVVALQRMGHDRVVRIFAHGDLTARDGRTFPYIT